MVLIPFNLVESTLDHGLRPSPRRGVWRVADTFVLLLVISPLFLLVRVRRAYEDRYFGHTAEERLLDITRRSTIGPAEGEPGVTRVETSTSNGVQVRRNVR